MIRQIPLTLRNEWDTLKTCYRQCLHNIDPYHQLFIVFAVLLVSTAFTDKVYFCPFYYLRVIFICYVPFGYAGFYIILLRRLLLVPPRPVICLLALLLLFISNYYLGYCPFSPWHSHLGNWNCSKGFLLIVCNVMLQNYYERKIIKLYIRERLFVEKMHQKRANAERLCKIWLAPFVPW